MAERVVGHGSFGIVFQVSSTPTFSSTSLLSVRYFCCMPQSHVAWVLRKGQLMGVCEHVYDATQLDSSSIECNLFFLYAKW